MGSGKMITACTAAAVLLLTGGGYLAATVAGRGTQSSATTASLLPSPAAVSPAATADYEGIWMGELKLRRGKTVRIVYHLHKGRDGTYYGTADSPDEDQAGIVLDRITVTGNRIRIEVEAVEATYEGVRQDGRIVGGLTQRNERLPLDLERIRSAPPVRRAPSRTEIRINPALLDRYVGEYAAGPGDTASVTREGDRLMVKVTGFAKLPIYPESETRFFFRAFNAQISFGISQNGTVDRLVRHLNGEQRVFRRVR